MISLDKNISPIIAAAVGFGVGLLTSYVIDASATERTAQKIANVAKSFYASMTLDRVARICLTVWMVDSGLDLIIAPGVQNIRKNLAVIRAAL